MQTADRAIVRAEAEALLYEEARLLDAGRYTDWLALYAAEATYWIPSWKSARETVGDPKRELSYVHLSRDSMRDYVVRMESGLAYATQPVLRMTRLIGNLVLDRGQAGVVHSKWIMHVHRTHASEVFSGDCEHRLVREDDMLRIAAKKVVLINDRFEFGYMPLV